jgi:hypothetical protein
MIPAEALELEALMMHPRPVDVGPMYAARLVDKLWTVIRPATGEQVYTPPNFLHAYGRDRQAVESIAENLNMGLRYIDVIVAHEITYNPRNAEPC